MNDRDMHFGKESQLLAGKRLKQLSKWSCIYQSEMREGCGCVDIGKPSAMEVKFSCSRFNLALS